MNTFHVTEADDGFCLESWNADRKLTVYVDKSGLEIIKVDGSKIEDGTTLYEAIKWLNSDV